MMRKLAEELIREAQDASEKPLSRTDALGVHVDEIVARMASGEGADLLKKLMGLVSHVHRYSFGNMILQFLQAPDAPLCASMKAYDRIAKEQGHKGVQFSSRRKKWTQFTRKVKGAKKVVILMPIFRKFPKVEVDDETGEETTVWVKKLVDWKETQCWASTEIVYCDDGKPFEVPNLRCPVEDEGLWNALLAFCEHKGIEVKHEELGGALGVSRKGQIGVTNREHWTKLIGVLAHEIAHELIHPEKKVAGDSTKDRETEAELTAAVMMLYFGHEIESALAYLQSHKATPKDLFFAATKACKAAGEVIEFIGTRGSVPAKPTEALQEAASPEGIPDHQKGAIAA